MSTTFAHDADLEHSWATAYRIPVVGSEWPAWNYEVALVCPRTTSLYALDYQTPGEDEARVIGSLIDYRRSYYNERWQQKMLERPLDVDGGTNSIILAKLPYSWTYRRASFRHGLWPFFDNTEKHTTLDRAGLMALLDHVKEYDSGWPKWKAAHSDVFPAAEAQQ